MAVRSARLGTHRSTGAREGVTVYTCPPDKVAIVKSVVVSNQGSAQAQVQVYAFASLPGPASRIYHWGPVPAEEHLVADAWDVLEPGDLIYCFADRPTVDFWISGTELPSAG